MLARARRYKGSNVVLGIRPEGLEDAALESDTPVEQRIGESSSCASPSGPRSSRTSRSARLRP